MALDRDRLMRHQQEAERVLERNRDALESTRRDAEQYRAVFQKANEGIPRAQRALRRAGYLK